MRAIGSRQRGRTCGDTSSRTNRLDCAHQSLVLAQHLRILSEQPPMLAQQRCQLGLCGEPAVALFPQTLLEGTRSNRHGVLHVRFLGRLHRELSLEVGDVQLGTVFANAFHVRRRRLWDTASGEKQGKRVKVKDGTVREMREPEAVFNMLKHMQNNIFTEAKFSFQAYHILITHIYGYKSNPSSYLLWYRPCRSSGISNE